MPRAQSANPALKIAFCRNNWKYTEKAFMRLGLVDSNTLHKALSENSRLGRPLMLLSRSTIGQMVEAHPRIAYRIEF